MVTCRRVMAAVLVGTVGLGCGCGDREQPQGLPEGLELIEATPSDVSQGATTCWIDVHGDCHGWVATDAWFADDYGGASSNAGVCLHRAREYAIWCGLTSPFDVVYAAFNLNGVTAVAQRFQPGFDFGNVDPRVVTYGYNWVPLATSATEATVIGTADPSTSRYPNIWRMQ
jgi:hypothetical protein